MNKSKKTLWQCLERSKFWTLVNVEGKKKLLCLTEATPERKQKSMANLRRHFFHGGEPLLSLTRVAVMKEIYKEHSLKVIISSCKVSLLVKIND